MTDWKRYKQKSYKQAEQSVGDLWNWKHCSNFESKWLTDTGQLFFSFTAALALEQVLIYSSSVEVAKSD